MSKHNDGGPAFPRSASQHSGSNNGMSLRDYFAAKALEGLLADGFAGLSCVAKSAYEYADAMLAEREKERE